MAKYGLKSSVEAWNFVRSVTGYGKAKINPQQEGDVTRESTCGVVENRDSLDYARFDEIIANWERENDDGQGADSSFTQPSKTLKPVARLPSTTLEQSELITSELNTSDYFNSDMNYINQGCAHDRSKERALYERPTLEKLRMAERFRLDGNNFYAKGDFQVAGVHYKKALIYFEYTFPENQAQEDSLQELKIRTHLNLAAVMYSLEEYGDCIEQCRQALKLDSKSAKAHFRTGLAHMKLDNFDGAEKSLLKAAELLQGDDDTSSSTAVEKNLSILAQKRIEYEAKTPEITLKMARGLIARTPGKKISKSVGGGVLEKEEHNTGVGISADETGSEAAGQCNIIGEVDEESVDVDRNSMTSDGLVEPSVALVGQDTPTNNSRIEHHRLTDDRLDDLLADDDFTEFKMRGDGRDEGSSAEKKDPAMFLLKEFPSFTAFADGPDSQIESPRLEISRTNGREPAETKLFFYGGILGMTILSIFITAGTVAMDRRRSSSLHPFKATLFSIETLFRLIALAFPCACLTLVFLSHFFSSRVVVR